MPLPLVLVFGELVRNWRLMSGMSQKDVGEALDVSGAYVGLIESGERIPTDKMAEKFAEQMGRPAADLVALRRMARLARANASLEEVGSGAATPAGMMDALRLVDSQGVQPSEPASEGQGGDEARRWTTGHRTGRPSRSDVLRERLRLRSADLREAELNQVVGFVEGLLASRGS